uniref:Secreted protein n=1 Tax=Cucumis melo TaxID=3656 RepID=A0A9I9CFX7_CUCME
MNVLSIYIITLVIVVKLKCNPFHYKKKGSTDASKPELRWERLHRRKNGCRQERRERCIMKDTPDVRMEQRRQRITDDALFADKVNTSTVENC